MKEAEFALQHTTLRIPRRIHILVIEHILIKEHIIVRELILVREHIHIGVCA